MIYSPDSNYNTASAMRPMNAFTIENLFGRVYSLTNDQLLAMLERSLNNDDIAFLAALANADGVPADIPDGTKQKQRPVKLSNKQLSALRKADQNNGLVDTFMISGKTGHSLWKKGLVIFHHSDKDAGSYCTYELTEAGRAALVAHDQK